MLPPFELNVVDMVASLHATIAVLAKLSSLNVAFTVNFSKSVILELIINLLKPIPNIEKSTLHKEGSSVSKPNPNVKLPSVNFNETLGLSRWKIFATVYIIVSFSNA